MSPLRPHPKSLSQFWERDFERFSSLLPILGEACPELVEGGLGDEGNTGVCKRDMLPMNWNEVLIHPTLKFIPGISNAGCIVELLCKNR